MVQQKSLLQKMEEAIGLIRVLQQEKDEATAKANAIESENREIKALLTLAESKADEMLAVKGASPKDDHRPKFGVPEPKETPAAEESDRVPSMDQRTPATRDTAATDAAESQKKPSEDQTKSWAELRERFRRPLSTS